MKLKEFGLKALREVYTRLFGFPKDRAIDCSRVNLFDEEANNYIYKRIAQTFEEKEGLALCKLGTIELGVIIAYMGVKFKDVFKFLKGYPVPLFYEREWYRLQNNSGVFPASKETCDRFSKLMIDDLKEVDILASYAWGERYVEHLMQNCMKVNLEGYYAPFLYKSPWTKVLEGKRVLVIHPFAESIESQYSKRHLLFKNQDVLPKFASLQVIKAVQSIAGNECEFDNWFDALESMKDQMSKCDFDIALIGCGAYGMPLTLHAKRLGKVGVHLAGWTQMLFGIYGKRWVQDQPKYAKFINDAWIRPSDQERPKGFGKVEGGCYW